MTLKDAVQVLNIVPPITPDELTAAYEAGMNEWHPDRFNGDANQTAMAHEKATQVHEAYELLSCMPETGYPFKVTKMAPSPPPLPQMATPPPLPQMAAPPPVPAPERGGRPSSPTSARGPVPTPWPLKPRVILAPPPAPKSKADPMTILACLIVAAAVAGGWALFNHALRWKAPAEEIRAEKAAAVEVAPLPPALETTV